MKLSWTVFGALVAASLAATVTTLPAASPADTVPANPTFTTDLQKEAGARRTTAAPERP